MKKFLVTVEYYSEIISEEYPMLNSGYQMTSRSSWEEDAESLDAIRYKYAAQDCGATARYRIKEVSQVASLSK